MPATKTKPTKKRENGAAGTPKPIPVQPGEVLNLPEAAEYLRVGEEDLLRLVGTQGLPGRNIGNDWRFLKAALQDWLCKGPTKKGLLNQLGAIKDDPFAEEMLKEIYKRRGRPETEGG